jgi:hypothetical protein
MRLSVSPNVRPLFPLAALVLAGCGGGPTAEPKSADEPPKPSLDWAQGAPEISPAYTEEELLRLNVCPLITTVVLSAGRAKAAGSPAETHLGEIRRREWDSEAIRDLVLAFTKATYDTEYEDLFAFSQQTQETCVKEIGEVSGAQATRANFCLNRNMVEAAGAIFKREMSESELADKLQYFPGYGAPYLAVGYREKSPSHEHWQECIGMK